mmetsp:Transcript_76977/g.160182  ORF Transcript_76977/g.160182 Transcript_76977/m.160182 type:complete len:92 (+) Transcript_76977:513-788(+)
MAPHTWRGDPPTSSSTSKAHKFAGVGDGDRRPEDLGDRCGGDDDETAPPASSCLRPCMLGAAFESSSSKVAKDNSEAPSSAKPSSSLATAA